MNVNMCLIKKIAGVWTMTIRQDFLGKYFVIDVIFHGFNLNLTEITEVQSRPYPGKMQEYTLYQNLICFFYFILFYLNLNLNLFYLNFINKILLIKFVLKSDFKSCITT